MTSMFWGLRLEPGKRYSTTVGRSFHVSMAALDCTTVKNENEVNCVMLEENESDLPFILCNLQKQKSLQCQLDLNFMTGDRVTFFCKGNGTIHLSGYVQPDDDELGNLLGEEEEEDEEEDGEDEEDEESITTALQQLAKKTANGLSNKRVNESKGKPAAKRSKLEVEQGSEDDDLDEEEDDSDEDEEEEEGDEEEEEEEEDSDEEEESLGDQKPQKQKNTNQQQGKQKNEVQNGVAGKAKNKNKVEVGKPKAEGQANQKQQKQENAAQQKKTITGGIQIKDTRVGSGQICKPGQKASVYYVGRLKTNNKVFDSSKKGNGFSFTVGKGEVIKGWDLGVAGMKVGGKRTIICPPNMAYGAKGALPTIPPNSTLVFEVELRNLK